MLIIIIPKTKQDIFNCYGLPTGTIFKVLITIFILPRTQWVVEITLYLDHEQVCDLFKFHLTTKVLRWWVSEWVSEWLLFNANSAILSATSWREQVNFQWNDLRFRLCSPTRQCRLSALARWAVARRPHANLYMLCTTCFLMLKHGFCWKYQFNKNMFNFMQHKWLYGTWVYK
jgi:hypothetical protein